MPRISRAGDTLWSVSAFDPRKPVDPDWASRPPAPVLRSGIEEDIFGDGPYEHHHGTDEMQASPEGQGAADPNFDVFEPGVLNDPRHDERLSEVSAEDLRSIGEHARALRQSGALLEGSQGHYVESHPDSGVHHYYTYNPRSNRDWEPWNLTSMHWSMREPIQTRHNTFSDAVGQGRTNRSIIDRLYVNT